MTQQKLLGNKTKWALGCLAAVSGLTAAFIYGREFAVRRPPSGQVRVIPELAEGVEVVKMAIPPEPAGNEPSEIAAWVRPRPGEEPWRELGWMPTLEEAQELAQQTNRLLFLWGTNEPMGRC